jgi:hypothetical protein
MGREVERDYRELRSNVIEISNHTSYNFRDVARSTHNRNNDRNALYA